MEENKEIKEELKNEASELSDEQLEQVAGGSPYLCPRTPDKPTPIV